MLEAKLEASGGAQDTPGKQRWAQAVRDNVIRLSADMGPLAAGDHHIRLWRIDDNVVPTRLELRTVEAPEYYLGAPARPQRS